jgi:hypothetical protein
MGETDLWKNQKLKSSCKNPFKLCTGKNARKWKSHRYPCPSKFYLFLIVKYNFLETDVLTIFSCSSHVFLLSLTIYSFSSHTAYNGIRNEDTGFSLYYIRSKIQKAKVIGVKYFDLKPLSRTNIREKLYIHIAVYNMVDLQDYCTLYNMHRLVLN